MDNRKTFLPRVLENGKSLQSMFKLPCKVTGVVIYSGRFQGNRNVKFYTQHTEFVNGSSMTCSLLYIVIENFLQQFNWLPPKLIINLDNTGKENKNRHVFAFLEALVKKGIFQEIQVEFLVVGHTARCFHMVNQLTTKLFLSV